MAGKRRLWALSSIAAILSLGQAMAQSKGTVTGTVLDPTRAPISGARVVALRDGAASGVSTVSDGNGEFSLTLEAGTYTVKAVAERFREASLRVTLAGNVSESRDFVLELAGVRDT